MIKKLSDAYAPSAKEEDVRNIIIKDLIDFYPDVKTDNLGNLIIHKPGKKKSIAITAPMDEVSFLITHESKSNKLISTSICNVNPRALQNTVCFDENKKNYIISKIPDNCDKTDKIRNIEFSILDYCEGKKLYNSFISKTLVYGNELKENNEYYIGKALERSVCCTLLCDIARNVANSIYEYYFVFSAQNYCDKKGALTATFGIEIDELYNLCCVDSNSENIEAGKGPVVILRDKMLISDIDLISNFETDKPLQRIITSNFVCEGGYYQKQPTTQKVISVGIPVNFGGCFNEVVSKNDIKNLKSLVLEKILP